MTSSILPSLQQLQPAGLVSGMAQAVVLVGCSVKALQKKIEQHLFTHSCQSAPCSDCFSIEDLQSAALQHKWWVGVKGNLKALAISRLAKNQELLAQIIQIVSAICQVLNRLLRCLINPAGTRTASGTQILMEKSYGQLSPRQRVRESTISQPAQTLLECGTIAFFNQPEVNRDPKNHPKDTLRLLARYRKLNKGTRSDRAVCCGKRIFNRKRVGVLAGWCSRLSTL
ncbi:hypothetical protein [Microcoleus sp. FACHB-672]|uniref:hypothetical protein n=1 Tax=Microcoleus sp. FACHB-672 TaxID=2692825 RepID=UPI0016889999|nr:hypothetical protein [Microcoleus sp. FACHB-672]MBD2039139.1 hypothetical protein [Microcoleus sp. FACHB-672]